MKVLERERKREKESMGQRRGDGDREVESSPEIYGRLLWGAD